MSERIIYAVLYRLAYSLFKYVKNQGHLPFILISNALKLLN